MNDSNLKEDTTQFNEYLAKLMQLVPNLKDEQLRNIITTSNGNVSTSQLPTNYMQQLERIQHLSLAANGGGGAEANGNNISDLEILQSVMDYIVDLQEKILANNN